MSRLRRMAIFGALALLGAASIAASGLLRERPRAQPTKHSNPSSSARAAPRAQVVLVRRRGGVPASWARRLRRADGVAAVARMGRTQALLRRSARKGGA